MSRSSGPRPGRRVLVATFGSAAAIVEAARASRERGFAIVDAYTPFAVHGLDEAMGLRPSRLPWACFAGGAAGCAIAWWLQIWTSAHDWPLDVGGKPLAAWPAFVPVAFELTVLLAGLTAFVATFARSGLWPGKRARLAAPRLTCDRFALVLEEAGASYPVQEVVQLCERAGALAVEERYEPGEATP